MLSKNNFLMNKIYLFTAAFAVMASLSGCSDTELASIDTAQEKTPIGFHTVGSQMGSRATIIKPGDITKRTSRCMPLMMPVTLLWVIKILMMILGSVMVYTSSMTKLQLPGHMQILQTFAIGQIPT